MGFDAARLRTCELRLRLDALGGQLRRDQPGEQLPLMNLRAAIDANPLHEADDLGVDGDDFIRLQLAGKRDGDVQRMRSDQRRFDEGREDSDVAAGRLLAGRRAVTAAGDDHDRWQRERGA